MQKCNTYIKKLRDFHFYSCLEKGALIFKCFYPELLWISNILLYSNLALIRCHWKLYEDHTNKNVTRLLSNSNLLVESWTYMCVWAKGFCFLRCCWWQGSKSGWFRFTNGQSEGNERIYLFISVYFSLGHVSEGILLKNRCNRLNIPIFSNVLKKNILYLVVFCVYMQQGKKLCLCAHMKHEAKHFPSSFLFILEEMSLIILISVYVKAAVLNTISREWALLNLMGLTSAYKCLDIHGKQISKRICNRNRLVQTHIYNIKC